MKTLKPFGTWILVNVLSASQSVGGIVIPESATPEGRTELIVEAIGEGVKNVKVGDSIVFMMQQAIKVELPNVEKGRVLIKEELVLGKLEQGVIS